MVLRNCVFSGTQISEMLVNSNNIRKLEFHNYCEDICDLPDSIEEITLGNTMKFNEILNLPLNIKKLNIKYRYWRDDICDNDVDRYPNLTIKIG